MGKGELNTIGSAQLQLPAIPCRGVFLAFDSERSQKELRSMADRQDARGTTWLGGHMKRVIVSIMTAAVLVATARTAMAQATSVTPHMRTETATIEAIEASTRTITLKKPDGTYVTTVAGPEVKRFPELKIGD
jgi:hypothetical protein